MTQLTDPSSNPTRKHVSNTNSDEIDLKELLLTLWDGRLLIIVVTLLITVAAAAYAYLSTPVYVSLVQVTPPSRNSQIGILKAYSVIENGQISNSIFSSDALNSSAENAYNKFLNTASSITTQQSFFEKDPNYDVTITTETNNSYSIKAHSKLTGTVTIEVSAISNKTPAQSLQTNIVVSGSNAAAISDLANEFAKYSIEQTIKEISKSIDESVHLVHETLMLQADALRNSAKLKRDQRIAALNESLILAESLNLETPTDAIGSALPITNETTYMRGANALKNEIALLTKRASDENFIPELIDINRHLKLLTSINGESLDISVAQINMPAIEPTAPIKPRKNLIIAVGLVLGSMLGIFLVLMRNMFKD